MEPNDDTKVVYQKYVRVYISLMQSTLPKTLLQSKIQSPPRFLRLSSLKASTAVAFPTTTMSLQL